jgi:MFS family permease
MEKKRVNRKLAKKAGRLSIVEGSFTALMLGFGNRYITPYALVLGASNFMIGILSTLPNFIGNLHQLVTLRSIKKKSRKEIVALSAVIQASLWLLVIGLGIAFILLPEIRGIIPILLIIIYTSLILAGSYGVPAWNSWMRDLIIEQKGTYFGIRNRVINIVIVFGMFTASFILSLFSENNVLIGFFIIFFIAFLGRMMSFSYLKKQYEPEFIFQSESYFSLKAFVKKMFSTNFGRFVFFVSLISFSASIAGPFFAVYMLKELSFSYIQYTFVTLGTVITTVYFMPKWGRFADEYGNVKILKITGALISLPPLLWALSYYLMGQQLTMVIYLFALGLFSGFAWSGFNLAASLFIFDAVSKEKMTYCTTYFNIINSFGAFTGAILGGIIASLNFKLLGLGTILFVFILSGILRIIVMIVMSPKIVEVRESSKFSLRHYLKEEMTNSKAALWKVSGFKPFRIFTQS